jgi:hypothetical protein
MVFPEVRMAGPFALCAPQIGRKLSRGKKAPERIILTQQ